MMKTPTPAPSFDNMFKHQYCSVISYPSNKLPKHDPIRPLVLCGPSGTGKTTLVKMLMAEFDQSFGFSTSHTTRSPRAGEQNGRDYHFVTREEMDVAKSKGHFIETAEFSGNMYGTSKKAVMEVQEEGRICILDIDIKGVQSLKATELKPRCVFIRPPSLEELELRLRGRGTETEESLMKRLNRAIDELKYVDHPDTWDMVVVNDNLESAYDQLKSFLQQHYQLL